MIQTKQHKEFSSFRDPSGFIFRQDKNLYRWIRSSYKEHYDAFIKTGLYDLLNDKNYIIPFTETEKAEESAYKIIQPQKIDFISYPYEWSFSQYKDAALLTLKIQKEALLKGMTLKDASAYNIQFLNNRPIHIDTLSFEKLIPQKPWIAYQQFCKHFLAPLSLMSYVDIRLNTLMKDYIDGIPLDLAATLLPKFKNFGVFINIHLNAFFSKKYPDLSVKHKTYNSMTLQKHLILIDELIHTVEKLKSPALITEWGNYYSDTNYTDKSFCAKESIISTYLKEIPKNSTLWDFGANNGYFTRLATKDGIKSIAFDIDTNAVEANYLKAKNEPDRLSPFPLLLDLTNPSPGIGWANKERKSIFFREKPTTIMALALIHHLVISNNIPFQYIAKEFSEIAEYLIIEFVDKNDSQVQKMLSTKNISFDDYTITNFENKFFEYYKIIKKEKITGTFRTLYFFKRKNASI